MTKIKSTLSLVVILGVIMMGAANAKAGMLMSDFAGGSNTNPCTTKTESGGTKVDNGIIVVDNGIIVVGLATIFGQGVVDAVLGKDEVPTECGIIVHD